MMSDRMKSQKPEKPYTLKVISFRGKVRLFRDGVEIARVPTVVGTVVKSRKRPGVRISYQDARLE